MSVNLEGGVLADKWGVPPFSVFDMASGQWQQKKQEWLSLGIRSEIGRSENLLRYSKMVMPNGGGASVFDPVLCEAVYNWFCPPNGQVVDPFAGGSVRGVVAGYSGLKYWGCDLSEKQILANREQAKRIAKNHLGVLLQIPEWVVGDSAIMVDGAPMADFIFSRPPYSSLKVYSDDPRDLSQMEQDDFLEAYALIIEKAADHLKDDSFACFVVGDYRGKDGYLNDFVSETTQAFKKAGLRLYYSFVLRTPTGSAGKRAERIFGASGKAVAVHQNVLVFCNGDWKRGWQRIHMTRPE